MDREEQRRQGKLADKAPGKPVTGQPEPQRQLAIQQALDLAVQHHAAGDLGKAEGIYQQVLQTDPSQPVALHLLGVIAHQVGNNDVAVDLITRALAIKPDFAEAHNNLGNALKELGKLDEAVASFLKALAINPEFAEAHNNLGNVFKELGRLDEAVAGFHKALAIKPDYAGAHDNLGNTLIELGRLEEAAASYRKALAINPDLADAHYNLGNVFKELGRPDEAVASFHNALAVKPDYAEAHSKIGRALHDLGKLDEAAASYRKAIAAKPDYAEAHNNLGNALQDLEKLDEAVASYRKALAIKPDFTVAHNNLGNALKEQEKLDEAVASYLQALAINPDFAEAHSNLGIALKELEKLDEAVASYRKALAIKPDLADAHYNLGNTLIELGRLDEAVASLDRALALKPDLADAHANIGMLQLLMGDFQNGWEHFTWRWRTKDFLRPRDYREPFWDGGKLAGKTIFVYPEQGVGDVIQFSRYLPLLAAGGGRVLFEVPKALFRLYAGGGLAENLVKAGESPPPFDCHAPLLDLPRHLKTTAETIPGCSSYLEAAGELKEEWANRLGPLTEFRVGIAWAGNPIHKNDHNRSIEASLFRPLTEIPGISIYSLQVGRNGEAARVFGEGAADLAPHLTDYAETAAAIGNLDLVVSVDTSVAHLAGVLGKPVWTLLAFMPDWRWLLERDDSPWYPTMRLFRQEKRGDWRRVIEDVGKALKDRLANTRE